MGRWVVIRSATILGFLGLLAVATATPAIAHVTVNPREAEPGGFTVLTFRVPNEREDANTVELAVAFPTDQPLRSVSVRPHPGWTYEVTREPLATPIETDDGQITEAVSVIEWRAANADAEIKPGEYDEFSVSVGPLPEVDQLVFPTIQTYSSGEVVRWIEQPGDGGEELDFPAPVLSLTAPAPAADPQAGSVAVNSEPSDDAATSDGTARLLAIVALVVGLLAGLLAGLALRRGGSGRAAH